MADCFVGVDVGGTKLYLVAVGEGPRIERRLPSGRDMRPRALADQIARFAADLPQPPTAIGIAVPGLIDADGEVVDCDVLPHLKGWAPRQAPEIECPLTVMNDVEAALTEETSDLPPRANAAMVMAGTGIGAAFLVDGAILRGSRGWAGELGHVVLSTVDGDRTLDELAGGAALLQVLGDDFEAILEACRQGDSRTASAIRSAGRYLGLGISIIIHLFNPEIVVLGGGVLRYPGYLEAAQLGVEENTLSVLRPTCRLRPCREPLAAAALGAARLARRSLDDIQGPR